MAIRELSLEEAGAVSGASLADYAAGAAQALDYAGRGAFIGGTIGLGLFSPEMAALGAAAGAVYGAGIGFIASAQATQGGSEGGRSSGGAGYGSGVGNGYSSGGTKKGTVTIYMEN